jgi:hypothetical protein
MYKRAALIALTLLALALGGTANADKILPGPEQVSEHVFAWFGPLEGPNKQNQCYRMNLAFVVGGEAVAVLDTGEISKGLWRSVYGNAHRAKSD